MHTSLQTVIDDPVATLTFIAPSGKPPAIDQAVLSQLTTAINELRKSRPRLLVINSRSEKYFCVGANLNILKGIDSESIVPWVRQGHAVLNQLEDLPFPVIAHVSGYALGGGLELAMAADLIFASSNAVFGQTEAGLGFIPGWGGCFRFPERVGHARAKRYFYTSELIDAATAAEIGLVDFVGEPSGVAAALAELQEKILANSAYAIETFKRIVNDQRKTARDAHAEIEAQASRGCLEGPSTQERLKAFFERKR